VGLIPGVDTIGWGHRTADGFVIDQPFFRGANADLNMTLAMALVFFACWIVWALQEVGPGGFLKGALCTQGREHRHLKVVMIVVFFAAGCLEIVSILFRPVSLSFRLYGNIFAGENMLETMSRLVPGLGWLLPIPFYFMELLVAWCRRWYSCCCARSSLCWFVSTRRKKPRAPGMRSVGGLTTFIAMSRRNEGGMKWLGVYMSVWRRLAPQLGLV
jgi:hypothetical protein